MSEGNKKGGKDKFDLAIKVIIFTTALLNLIGKIIDLAK